MLYGKYLKYMFTNFLSLNFFINSNLALQNLMYKDITLIVMSYTVSTARGGEKTSWMNSYSFLVRVFVVVTAD